MSITSKTYVSDLKDAHEIIPNTKKVSSPLPQQIPPTLNFNCQLMSHFITYKFAQKIVIIPNLTSIIKIFSNSVFYNIKYIILYIILVPQLQFTYNFNYTFELLLKQLLQFVWHHFHYL